MQSDFLFIFVKQVERRIWFPHASKMSTQKFHKENNSWSIVPKWKPPQNVVHQVPPADILFNKNAPLTVATKLKGKNRKRVSIPNSHFCF